MADTTLTASTRTEFGKGAARRLRRAHQIPAVLYGHGADPVHIALAGHATMLALKHTNALLEINLEGKTTLAIAKDVQIDPVKQSIEHVDLLIVKSGEKIAVDVPLHVVGESAPGTIHMLETQSLHLEAEATHLPSKIELSIAGLPDGTIVRASDITLPEGSSLLTEPDHIIVTVSLPSAQSEGEDAAAAVAAAPVEGA